MKIVMQTQILENYGAHDWDGTGECPQYWKPKGGNTYVLHGVSIEQAMGSEIWDTLRRHITENNESWQEYIISDVLVDDVDYVESDHVEEWDSPINLSFAGGRLLATRYTEAERFQTEISGKFEQWVQLEGGQKGDYKLLYEMADDGSLLTYAEYQAREAA